MLYLTYSLDIFLLIAIPIALGVFLVRKFDLEGRWWWIGAVVFMFSQIILLPLENYLINPFLNSLSISGTLPSLTVLILGAFVLGLSTAVCEELLRYAMYHRWTKDARTFLSALLLGTGHGGAASIILGFLVLYNFILMTIFRNRDLSTLMPTEQVKLLQNQITVFWSAPWFYTFREVIGQILMITIQISLSVMVLQAFLRKHFYWVFLAIGFHTLVEAGRVVSQNLSNEMLTNAVLGVFAVLSIIIISALRHGKDVVHSTEDNQVTSDQSK